MLMHADSCTERLLTAATAVSTAGAAQRSPAAMKVGHTLSIEYLVPATVVKYA
jgi:hypothetical protein